MRFKKADPQQARLKVSIYGPPGSGKTFTTLLMAEGLARIRKQRIAFVDTEHGTDFYAKTVPAREVHPQAFDFDAIYTRSLADITDAVKSLDPKEHGIVVIDSISHLWDSAIDAYGGKRTRVDSIPLQAWAKIKKPYKDLVKFLIGSTFDVFLLGRQKNLFGEDEKGELQQVGVAMRAEGETAYEPHICMRLYAEQDKNDSTKSTYWIYVEKDRTGILSGRVIQSPGFKTVEPILPLLGETQAPEEDEEERAAKDADLAERGEDERAQTKAAKSKALRQTFALMFTQSTGLGQLDEAAEAVRKQQRYILADDMHAIRAAYKTRRDVFVDKDLAEQARSLDNFGAGLTPGPATTL